MTAIFTADLHLTDNPRDAYRFDFIPWLHEQVRQRKPHQLIIGGDLTEDKDRHSAGLVNRVVDTLHRLSRDVPIIILPGNHDYRNLDSPFFEFVRHINNIHWISEPTHTAKMPPAFTRELGMCYFLPHTPNYERDWKHLNFKGYDWIFAHNTFTGAKSGGRELSGVPVDIFPAGAQVISGDIHVPQTFGPITYVGAPYRVDFGDDYQPRILVLSGLKKTSVPIPGVQKRLVEVTSLDELRDAEKDLNEGDILKVRIDVDEPGDWREKQQRVKEWGAKNGYTIHLVQPRTNAKDKSRKSTASRLARSESEILEAYGKSRRVPEAVLKTGRWLMEKA